MNDSNRMIFRGLGCALIVCAALLFDISAAYAQASNCSRLQSMLRTLDRNGDFQNIDASTRDTRALARDVQNAESSYIRNGCNADAKAGRQLTRECQGIGRQVLKLREQYAAAAGSVETANAIAQQREGILQEMARFGCSNRQGGSSVTISTERQNIFDRIFGTNTDTTVQDGEIIGGADDWGFSGYGTVRTLCVRLSDGYFWPVSYSTLPEMAASDAAMCSQQCPGTPVDLYYYDNPGQEAEDMRNMSNEAYTSLPNAFRYRREFDKTSTCKPIPLAGNVTSIADADGHTYQFAEVAGVNIPMPRRDPRRSTAAIPVQPIQPTAPVQTAQLVDIPLPRPRPAGPGETPITKPIQIDGDTALRLVQIGDKVVRVVGPDTPYAQPVGAGT